MGGCEIAEATGIPPERRPVIETRDLSKRYGQVQALDRVTISVQPGCTGLLGPNGAGKTTLIRLALGLLEPNGGEIHVEKRDPTRQPLAVRALVGYMPEFDCLPTDWRAQDFVQYMGQLHGLPRRVAIRRASDTLYLVGLGEERYREIRGFSTGMRQRVKLAQALVQDPSIALLDEPTNGLDPEGRDEMLALVRRITDEMGITVLVSSHLLADIEQIADHVIILHGGRVVVQGGLRELITTTPTVTVRTHASAAPLANALRSRELRVHENDQELQIDADSQGVYDAIRDAAVETHSALVYLKRRVLSLEDVYLNAQSNEAVGD